MDESTWLLYGANGYTGRLLAVEAVRRGMKPTLAGRDSAKIQAIAKELQCPSRVFPLDDPKAVAANLAGHRAVLHCAGPFWVTARPMMEACLESRTHYLDITGEIPVIESAAAKSGRAAEAGIALLPAVGFDVVPSDCLAAMLAQRLPDAVRLELAFAFIGAMSPGTATTALGALPRGGRVRSEGKIVHVPHAWKTMEIPFAGGKQWAMTVPWGDVASAWHSTGIPNIEVFLAMPQRQIAWARRIRPLLGLLRYKGVQRLGRWAIARWVPGPTAAQQETSRGTFWGRVSDAQGQSVSATLTTPGGYPLTVSAALACLDRVLAGEVRPGFSTPSKAFGAEFVLSLPGTELRWL